MHAVYVTVILLFLWDSCNLLTHILQVWFTAPPPPPPRSSLWQQMAQHHSWVLQVDYNDVTWLSLHLKFLATPLFVQLFVQDTGGFPLQRASEVKCSHIIIIRQSLIFLVPILYMGYMGPKLSHHCLYMPQNNSERPSTVTVLTAMLPLFFKKFFFLGVSVFEITIIDLFKNANHLLNRSS